MVRYLVFVSLAVLAVIVEGTHLATWPTQALRFELVWIMVLYLGFSTSFLESALTVLTMGFVTDLAAGPFLGLYATIFFLFFALLRSFIAHMFVETVWARLLWVGILSVTANAVEWCLLAAMGKESGMQSFLWSFGLLQSVLNMFVAIVLFAVLDRIEAFCYGLRHES